MIKFLFFLFALSSFYSFSQNIETVRCTTSDSALIGSETVTLPAFGPIGTLKILLVLCKFTDDHFDQSPHTDLWPSTLNSMPSWGSSLVSETIQSNYADPSISGYFQDMSLNQFNVIGDVLFYQPLHDQCYYSRNSERHMGFLSEEILTGINDQVDFTDYDNWDPNDIDGDLKKEEPDGQVDFIAICFRFADSYHLDISTLPCDVEGDGYQGVAGLTGYRNEFGNGLTEIVLDNKIISASLLGSGTFQSGVIDADGGLPVIVHELGHYLFGQHIVGLGFHGLMDGEGTGVMSSYERIKMGWFEPIPVNSYSPDISIPDAISTGVVYKMEITNSTVYFLIDNHQRISYYESGWLLYNGGPLISPGTGLLILQIFGGTQVDIESASGRWDFERIFHYWGSFHDWLYSYPFKKISIDRISGEDEMDLRKKHIDANNFSNTISHSDILGASYNFFNMDYNQIFSPWSNPSTNSDISNLCVQILQKDQFNNIHVNFYTTNAVTAPPSKPQNLKMSLTTDRHPKLTWDKNLEPDMSQYKVYRSTDPNTGFTQIGTATHNPFLQTITYIDYTITVPLPREPQGTIYYYRVTARDNQPLESVKSDYVSAVSDQISKDIEEQNEIAPSSFLLFDNYPNPFNPSTTISFSIPERSFITLKVYDMLGREVVPWNGINEELEPGSFEKTFDAGSLASGVYIYRITAMKEGRILFSESKQMLLIK